MEPARRARIRRVLTTAVLFILVSGGMGAVIGITWADPGSGGPHGFHVGSPAVGDQGVVEIEDPGQLLRGDGVFRFEWREDREMSLPDGTSTTLHVVAYEDSRKDWGDARPTTRSFLIDPQRGIVIGWLTERHEDVDEPGTGFLGLSEGNHTKQRDSYSINFREDWSRRMPCTLYTSVQGMTVRQGQVIEDPSACERQFEHLPGYHEVEEESPTYYWSRVSSVWEQNGTRYMEVEHWQNRSRATFNGERYDALSGRSWFEEGIPYPVRAERYRTGLREGLDEEHRDRIEKGQQVVTYRLTRFGRGGQEVVLDSPTQTPGPGVEMAPRTPWMFEDRGIDHPFPASEAWEVAFEDPRSGLADFLSRRPDAYIAQASYREYEREDLPWPRHVSSWRLTFTDGDETHQVNIRKTTPVADPTGLEELHYYDYYDKDVRHPEEGYPAPSSLPGEVPTVESMWRLWERQTVPDFLEWGANSWEWGIRASRDQELRFSVHAGRYVDYPSTLTNPLEAQQTYRREHSILGWRLHEDPLPSFYAQTLSESRWFPSDPPLTHEGGAPPERPGEDPSGWSVQAAEFEVQEWALPSREQAAAVTLTALIVALGYYFHPLLKSGVLAPLFSRLAPGKVLDHPVRRKIEHVVKKRPGVHRGELMRRTGCSSGQIEHHLTKLVDAGILTRRRQQGYTCYFVQGDVDVRVMSASGAVRSKTARGVLQALREGDAVSSRELSRLVQVTQPTVVYHLKRLRVAGLVESVEGRTRLTVLGRRVLQDG